MGKIRRAIADFIRSRRVDDKRHPRFMTGYLVGLNGARLERECSHVFVVKYENEGGWPPRGAKAVCAHCGASPGTGATKKGPATVADFATRLFDLHGFMLLEIYRGKHAVTVQFPDLQEAQQFHNTLIELSQRRPAAALEVRDNG